LVATVGTLFIVPIIYSLLRRTAPINYDERIDKEYKGEITPEGKPAQEA
jgi:hypothetical protein